MYLFSITGYLTTKSAATSITLVKFAWKRLLRIQPMLILVCLFSLIFLGLLFSSLTTVQYFSSLYTWTYFRNIIPVFGIQFQLHSVFSNLSDKGVNGYLWTLIVEERLYIIVGLIAVFKAKKTQAFFVIVGLLNAVYIAHYLLFDGDFIIYFNESQMQYAMMFLNAGLLYHLNFPFQFIFESNFVFCSTSRSYFGKYITINLCLGMGSAGCHFGICIYQKCVEQDWHLR